MEIFQENNLSIRLSSNETEAFCKLIGGVYDNSSLRNEIGFSIKNKIHLDEDVEVLVTDLAIKLGIVELSE